ncbi:hypothetical protein [Hoylesella timonensis]|uniref:Uncharacterized protein n=1 Tax=Hoylesella timonensis S9-PR14 TaxID=1401062 RepID=A0A098YTQ7_9BACT|nr:hypothetical protein [Hoylesella timonensis]KGI22053.1 hypothetical protein HMPREF9304_06645 [Hoylesella timonensis S9-PR14]
MKKKYEKPVIEIIRMDDAMQMICGSPGFKSQTPIEIGKWDEPEETNANGTSEEINELPDWLKEEP